MDFKSEKPIYQQIIDLIFGHIASGQWPEGERIPSVRDLAAQLQVNPNTVMRAYERLQTEEVIFNRRGMGFSVAPGAKERIVSLKREEFFTGILPEVFAAMDTLGISVDEVERAYRERK